MKKIIMKLVDNEKLLLVALLAQLMIFWLGTLWVSYESQLVAYQKF